MKKYTHSAFCFILLGLIVFLPGCSSDKNKGNNTETPVVIRNKSKLEFPKGIKKVKLGDSLKVTVSAKGVSIDSVEVGYQSKQLFSTSDSSFSIPSLSLNATGTIRLITKIYLSNGESETLYPRFNVLPPPPKKISYLITNEFPHDKTSYTQGLFFKDGLMYESTGQYGTSRLMSVDWKTGKSIKSIDLDNSYFGEGITTIDDKIYQITYKEQQAFIYDLDFNRIHTFNYTGEGWGLTTYGDTLLMTNGSNIIYFRDKDSFEVIKTLPVHSHQGPVEEINELEIIDGYLYANIYQTDLIVKIDLQNGAVVGQLDLAHIWSDRNSYGGGADVLNGIAYLSSNDRMYVTGKLWPKLYEIKLVQ